MVAGFNYLGCVLILCWWEILQRNWSRSVLRELRFYKKNSAAKNMTKAGGDECLRHTEKRTEVEERTQV